MEKLAPKDIQDILTLTPLQEGMLFHYLHEDHETQSGLYFEQLSLEISGEINKQHFEKAWQTVIEKNEMLRTVFRWEKLATPSQIILKKHEGHISFYDLSDKNNIQKQTAFEEIKMNDRHHAFDLQKVAFRVILCKLAEKQYKMVISNHHILYDGWSNGIILKEFFHAYHAFYKKEPLCQSPTKPPFKEFIHRLHEQDKNKQIHYWNNYLAGFETQTSLPIEKKVRKTAGFGNYVIIPGEIIQNKLDIFAKNNRVSPAAIFYTAWGILLERYCSNEDVIFGTTISGRSGEIKGIEDMVGLFINTIPLRIHFHPGEKLIDAISKVNRVLHQRDEFAQTPLVEIQGCSLLGSSLFNMVVTVENYPLGNHLIPDDSSLSILSYCMVETTHYDLSVGIMPFQTLEITFSFKKELFELNAIVNLAIHFQEIIQNIIAYPEMALSQLEIISNDEKNRVLSEFNNTAAEYPRDKTIHGLFAEQAAQTPDYVAVFGHGQTRTNTDKNMMITYRQLNEQSNQLAGLLIEKGVLPNTIVGIMVERSVEMIAGILGILKSGGAYLPIDPEYPQERIDYMLKDSNAKILINKSEIRNPKSETNSNVQITNDQNNNSDSRKGCPHRGLNGCPRRGLQHSALSVRAFTHSNHLCYIIYTSGSTGRPKGVMIEHHSVMNLLFAMQNQYPFTSSDTYLLKTAYTFDVSVTELFGWYMGGGKLAILETNAEKDPQIIFDWIYLHHVTHINFVPSMFNAFLDFVDEKNKSQLKYLKYIFLAGEALMPVQVKKFKALNTAIALENLYGPTEGTVYASQYSLSNWNGLDTVPIGKPLQNIGLFILNKYNHLQPTGIPGELYIGGKGVAPGYLNQPELTSGRFLRNYRSYGTYRTNIFYKTGDLAKWLADGNIEYLGRIDQQVKIRGFRVELGEIENLLIKHDHIQDAVVTIKEDAAGDKYLAAYFVSGQEIPISELKAYLAKDLPDYMIPLDFMRLESFPLTSSGKMDRKKLPEPVLKVREIYAAPRNDIENKLVEIWAGVLGKDIRLNAIGIDDNFFRLGGHSLKAISLVSLIHKTFNLKIPLPEIFKRPTIRMLFAYINKATGETYTSIEPAEKKEYYALSSAQKRLYFLQQMDTAGTSYNISAAWVLEGIIDKPRLKKSIAQLIQRHESLQTSFAILDEEPVQMIHDKVEFEIEKLDGRGAPLWSPFIRSFDLSKAPLLRVGLAKIEEEKYIFLVDMHHIISDGVSTQVLVQDFSSFYVGKELPGIKLQYKDYSEWQKRESERKKTLGQCNYWQEVYAGIIPLLELPTDYARPLMQSFEGSRINFEITNENSEALKTLWLESGTTLYMVLLTIYYIFLAKLSTQADIVVGTPVAGRRHNDFENIIGMFVNTLALRNYPIGEKNFTGFLEEVKENVLKAFENQEYQYEDLVDQVVQTRDVSRNPLFDTMFALQNTGFQEIEIPGLKLTPYEYENNTAKFDLVLTAVELADHLQLNFEYSTKLFKAETINRFITYFKNIVNGIIENKDRKISDFEIITEEEKQQILFDFNDTAAEYPEDKTVQQLFVEQTERTPDHISLVGAGPRVCPSRNVSLTYRQLNDQADRLAGLLIEKGVLPDNIVGIMIERSIEMVIGIMGILKASCAYLPIDPGYPQERIDYMLKDSNVGILVTNEKKTNCQCSIVNSQLSMCEPRASRHHSNLAYIIYTSGSTGRPKGVMIEHRSVVNLLLAMQKLYPLTSSDTYLLKTAYTFDVSVTEIFGWYIGGGKLAILETHAEKDPQIILDWIYRHHVTHINFVPSMFNSFLDFVNDKNKSQLRSLKYIFLAGEALLPAQVKKSRNLDMDIVLKNIYGPTETTVYSSYYSLSGWNEIDKVPIGKPLANIKLYILNKYNHLQPLGIPGELYIGGVGTARGYLNQPELTSTKFLSVLSVSSVAKIYKTGDLAKWLPDGNIEFLGRMDQQVKIRGFRVELGEIGNRLLKHQQVKDAAVLAKKDATGDNYLAAYFVSNFELLDTELREYLAKDLPGYMVPSYFMRLEKIPLTASGKIDLKALPEQELKREETFIAPRNEIEKKLAEIWGKILGKNLSLNPIGIDDNFFRLGGHSLKATSLVSLIHKTFNVKIPLAEIFKSPTIRRLFDYINNAVKDQYILVEPLEKKEYYILSSAQKRLYFLQQMDNTGTVYNMPSIWLLEGKPDKIYLEIVFNKLIKQHESLRTSFIIIDEEPVQRIHDEAAFEIEYKDLATDKHGQTQTILTEKLTGNMIVKDQHSAFSVQHFIRSFIRPFDLSKAPLLRVGLLEEKGDRQILMVDMHHIISDGTSMNVLIKDFIALYQGENLPELQVQYKDFSIWQNSGKQGESIKQQQEYWLKEFTGEIPVLELPADFPRPAVQSFDGSQISFEIDKEAVKVLNSLALDQGATIYMALLAIFNVFLARVTNQDEIIVGSPIAGRRHTDLEKIIGMFVNTLVMRNYPSGEKTFSFFLQELKEKTVKAFENQDYQYEDLVEKVVLTRDTSRNPLFNAMFVLQNIGIAEINIPGLKLFPYPYENKTAKFDLSLSALETEEKLVLNFEYSTKLFKEETINRFIIYFKNVVNGIIENKDRRISDFEIITAEEKQQILFDFNNTAAEYPEDKTVPQLFVEQTERTPDHISLVGAGPRVCPSRNVSLTYRQLNEQSGRVAGLLIEKGVLPDNIVGIMIERSIEMIAGILGILKSGGAYLPIDPEYPQERIDYMLKDSNVGILVMNEKKTNCQCSIVNNQLSIAEHRASFHHSHLAYIIYTSGSTGKPKGALVDHRSVARLVKNTNYIKFEQGDRILQTGALTFDASTFEIWGALLNGLTLYLVNNEIILNAIKLKNKIRKHQITIMWMTAPLFNQTLEVDIDIFASLRTILVGGDKLSPVHINRLRNSYPHVNIINGYGPTENTTFSTTFLIDREYLENIPIGKPIANSTAYIVDKYNHLQPVGVPGELLAGGDGLARGYLNNPELTAERFLRNYRPNEFYRTYIFYKTGDLAKWLPDGNIEFLGRIDQQVKIRGFRVELGEIETQLLIHPDIKESVVIVMHNDIVAYIVPGKAKIPVSEIKRYLSGKLPAYMIPSYFVQLEKIPLTANGKLDRKALPKPELQTGESYTAPRNEIEMKLLEIWSEILDRDPLHAAQLQTSLSIDDNFFELGGHSLKATILTAKIHKAFQANIPLSKIFTIPTIREIADYIKLALKEKYLSIEPIEKKTYYALSSAQKRLYVLQQMDEQGVGYNVPAFFILEGVLDKDKLKYTFKRLIARHESLRTSFLMINDEPVQRIHDEVKFEIEYKDLATDKHGQTQTILTEKLTGNMIVKDHHSAFSIQHFIRSFIRPFDLSKAPLLRVGLLEEKGDRPVLMLDMHHIISDGISLDILVKDFMTLYQGENLPELQVQYKDFSKWQNSGKQGESIKQQREYWLKEFTGEIPVLELPVDYPRPAVQSFAGSHISFEIDKEALKVLNSLAFEQGATIYMALLAIFNVFLARLTNQDEIIVGSPIAGRRHTDLEKIIGMFVNTLALRNYPIGEKNFTGFLEEVKENVLKAFENQEYQYEDLVDQVVQTRDVSRNPLFDTMFALQNTAFQEIEIPGLKLTPYEYENNTAKFDLILTAVELADHLQLNFEYSTKLFKAETINRFITYFKNVVNGIIENKDRKISDFEIMTEEEKQQILFDFNDTAAEYPEDKTVPQLFIEQALKTPDHISLVGAGPRVCPPRRNVSLTYSQLNEQSDHLAGLLIEKGVLPDTIVAIMMEHSIEMIAGILGILKSGGAYLPIDPEYPQERIDYMLKDSNAKILINKSEIRNPKSETNSNVQITNDQNNNSDSRKGCPRSGLNGCPRRGLQHSAFSVRAFTHSNHLCYIIYTSGSTGRPKGVMIDHKSFVDFTTWAAVEFEHGVGYQVLLSNSFAADGSIQQIFPPLITGGVLHVITKELRLDTARYMDYLRVQRINNIDEVPALMKEMLALIDPNDLEEKLPHLTCLSLGSEYVPIDLIRKCRQHLNHKGRIINAYGPAEASVETTTYHCDGILADEQSLIGKPRRNIQVYILDKAGHCCPVGLRGEICITGVGLARGYLNRPELTSDRFYRSYRFNRTYILYKTGDLARWLPGGNIEFIGRIDNQVKIRGFRVELSEIENRLLCLTGIREAVVLEVGEASSDIYLCAYFVSNREYEISEFQEYLAKELPEYMIPSYYMRLEKIPLTPNGKIDRKALPKPTLKMGANYIAPRDDIEKKLVKIWSEILGKDECQTSIGIDDNFFLVGGHSLKATIMMSKIHKELDVKVELTAIFRNPNIRDIARLIRGLKKDVFQAIEPVEKKEYYALSSAQKRLYFLQQMDLNSTSYNMPMVLSLGKGIKEDKLEFAFSQLIKRHESLRTSIEKVNDNVVQRIHEQVEFEIEYKDLATDKHGQTQTILTEKLTGNMIVKDHHSAFSIQHFIRSFIRPFDLSKAPLIRSGLIKLPDGNYTWQVDVHHIVSDGTSHTILTEDFMHLYETGISLAPLPIQYKDFAQWQNQLFAGGCIKTQEDYWLELYAGEIPRLNLVADYKRPAVFNFNGDHYIFELDREEVAKIKALGARYGGTLYMNILAVLNILFYKYTGQSDIIIGSGIAGRRHADIQDVVGMFVNTLAMRNFPAGEKCCEKFFQEVIDRSIKCFENQDIQFEDLVEKLDQERDLSRNPLFDIFMLVQNFREVKSMTSFEQLLKDEKNSPAAAFKNLTSKFDMTFFVHENDDEVFIDIEYYTGIFKQDTIRRMVSHFMYIIKAVNKEPGIRLQEIEIISEEEKSRLLYEFNDTKQAYPHDKCITDLFEEQAERTPDHIALVDADNHMITYRLLDEQSNRLANYLHYEKNAGLSQPVGIMMDRSQDMVTAVFGILKAGSAYVPISPLYPRERIKKMVNDAGIMILISQKEYIKSLNRLQWECGANLETFLCMNSYDVYNDEETEENQLMSRKLWEYVGEIAVDEVTGGGWSSSYTGERFSQEEMDEYGDNILNKLEPLLHKDMRVLEIGTASGISMYRIAPQVGLYYGTDLSEVIIEKNKLRVIEEGHKNIKLLRAAAHEIDRLDEKNFDLVIINSVVQYFHGHNYLRNVLRKVLNKIGNQGYLFIGDIMDQDLKENLIADMVRFKQSHHNSYYKTKIDWSEELFISRSFLEDLCSDFPGIYDIEFSSKIHTLENELTRFRYDALLKIDKNRTTNSKLKRDQRHKTAHDLKVLANFSTRNLKLCREENSLAYIIYTSGSTGIPKGAMVDHASVVNLLCALQNQYPLTSSDTYLLKTSYTFDVSVTELFGWYMDGGKLAILEKDGEKDPMAIFAWIYRHHVTHINFVPSMFNAFLDFVTEKNKSRIAGLKYIFLAGEALLSRQVERFKNLNTAIFLENLYGPTEGTVYASQFSLSGWNGLDSIPIGKPLANVELFILSKYNHWQPIGIPGELYIGGVGTARGYLNNPELTNNRFIFTRVAFEKAPLDPPKLLIINYSPFTTHHSPIYKTGDLARWLPDGNIEFLGRIDHQVKVRGFRIELEEIEEQLLKHGNIKEAIIIDREDISNEKYLTAYFVSNSELQSSELREYLLKSLPDYMIPSYFVRLEKIPLSASGKVDRKALPGPGLNTGENYTAPRSEIEKKLAEIWSEILSRDALHSSQLQTMISIDDNFFHLGGHSLKATILVSKIHKAFQVNVPLTEIFKVPTIRDLADYIQLSAQDKYVSIEPIEKRKNYALSSAQKRLYVLQQMNEQNIGYNIPIFLVLIGQIDQDRFAQTFKLLIARHESLRTSFLMINDEPVQRIHDKVEFEIEYKDLATDKHRQTRTLTEVFGPTFFQKGGFIRSFDLSQAPLLRVGLLKEKGDRHILMLDMHHIVSDGTSLNILVKDFMALYQGERLPGLRVQYKDFSGWQNSEKQKESVKRQEDFWLKEFAGEIPLLELPGDYARPEIQGFDGASSHFEIDKETSAEMKNLSLETDTTIYMVLLAIYNVFLFKVSGQEDIVVGSPVAGRRHTDLEKIIGMFVNTLALRNYPSGEKKFRDFLAEIKEKTLKAFENQDYQYEDLVENADVTRDISRNPLFDCMFALQNTGSRELEIPGLKLVPYEYENNTAKFDLTLTAVELADKLLFTFAYSTKLFKPGTIERFCIYFKNLINDVIKNKEERIADFEIIMAEEKQQVLFDFNNTGVEYPEDKTVPQLFAEQAAQTPDAVALVARETREKHEKREKHVETLRATSLQIQISYNQLNEQSDHLAGLLIEKGVLPDNIVAIMVERSVEMVIGILGILKSGGAYMPIDPDYPQERIDYMLKDSNAAILLTDKEEINCQFSILNCQLSISGRPRRGLQHSALSVRAFTHSNHLCYVIYTSGSTGKPKGVLVEHRNAVNTVKWFVDMHKIGIDTRVIQLSGYTFDASVNQIFGTLISGAGLYIAPKELRVDIEKLRAYIIDNRINVINFVPVYLKELLSDVNKLESLHTVISGAEKLEEKTKEAIINKGYRLVNQYGPTEAAIDALAMECSTGPVNLGSPIANVKTYIIDKYENILPVGIAGELYITGAGVARGYLNNPGLTSEKFKILKTRVNKSFSGVQGAVFQKSPLVFYKTGDLAKWLPDGSIEFLGRIDNQVKIRGYRIELEEIANHLTKVNGIKEAVVLAYNEDSGNKNLCAYIVSEKKFLLSELKLLLMKELPDYMIPAYFVPLDRIPLTPSGKIDRKKLPRPGEMSLREDTGAHILPANDIEEKLVEIWEKVLGRNNIGVNENFFTMGGDSIKSIQIISRMRNEGYKIEMKDLFQYPVIANLAPRIKKIERILDQSVITGSMPLTPIQERFFSRALVHPHHYNQAVMLYFKEGLPAEKARVIFSKIQAHHDALRMTYTIKEGYIKQTNHDLEYPLSLQEYDLRAHENTPAAIEKHADVIQAGIDLEKGPMMKLGLFHCPDGDYLLIVIHHLVIDGVSWRILFEDIDTLYEQCKNSVSLVLPPKTDSFKWWAEKQAEYAQGNLFLKEKEYWMSLEQNPPPVIETDFKALNICKDTETLSFSLPEETTTTLLGKVNEAFGTEINDILLTALGLCITSIYGISKVLVALEGHGREKILKDIDITRTVGWFTTVYPIILDMSYKNDLPRQIKVIKEHLHQIPQRGIGYGILKYLTHQCHKKEIEFRLQPQICFNYLGQFDTDVKQNNFTMPTQSLGNFQDPGEKKEYLLDISGIVSNHCLTMSISYNKMQYKKESIEKISGQFKQELLDIISHCTSRKKKELTPSDFAYKNLSLKDLNDINKLFNKN